MHDGNRIYHRALRNLDLDWREGVIVQRREWVAPGTAPSPTLGGAVEPPGWCGMHRDFKRKSAQCYHEQCSRSRNQPRKN